MIVNNNILIRTILFHKLGRTYMHKTHYQILNLPPSCSPKDIKDAYIKLTKKYHPDTSGGKYTKEAFLQVAEAYKVLSNPYSKLNYDNSMGLNGKKVQNIYYNEPNNIRRPWMNHTTQENFNDNEYVKSDSYYGIKGIKRVSNSTFALLCLLVASIGVGLQIFAIRRSMTYKRDFMNEKSKIAEANLDMVRHNATERGNEVQIEMLKQRFEGRFKK